MIAVDAMGGDFSPRAAVLGALIVAKKNIKVGLYGDQVQLFSLLYECDIHWEKLPIHVVHCAQVIEMAEQPTVAIAQKKESSLVRALYDLRNGDVTAVVSAGNSGAILAGGSLIVGRVAGVRRPAIGAFLATHARGGTFCIDLGANADCRPEHLVQFALIGHVYSKMTYHIAVPRVGLLSNGHEQYKGSSLVKETYELLKNHPLMHFIGNVEPDALFKDQVDVVVTDGFSGNVMLKTAEAMAATLFEWFDAGAKSSWCGRMAAFLNKNMLSAIKKRVDYERKGGALLLGVRQPIVIAHGASNAHAIASAIILAHKKVKSCFVERFSIEIASLLNDTAVLMHQHSELSVPRDVGNVKT